jgi:hypothetical protein
MAFEEVAEGDVQPVAWPVGPTLIESWLSPVGIASPPVILVI